MRVRALQKIYYARQDRMPGDVYEMDDRESVDIKILTALGKIEILRDELVPAPQVYETKVVEAEPAPVEPMATDNSEPVLGAPRRTYRRRDMRAER